jgi:hypothetical protein
MKDRGGSLFLGWAEPLVWPRVAGPPVLRTPGRPPAGTSRAQPRCLSLHFCTFLTGHWFLGQGFFHYGKVNKGNCFSHSQDFWDKNQKGLVSLEASGQERFPSPPPGGRGHKE